VSGDLTTLAPTVGVRGLSRLPADLASDVAACQSHHRDISLNF